MLICIVKYFCRIHNPYSFFLVFLFICIYYLSFDYLFLISLLVLHFLNSVFDAFFTTSMGIRMYKMPQMIKTRLSEENL